MEQMKCPGQDTRFWKPDDIFVAECPKCGAEIEFFKDDARRRCAWCGHMFYNPKIELGCAEWCQYAEKCVPDLVRAKKAAQNFKELLSEMVKSHLRKGPGSLGPDGQRRSLRPGPAQGRRGRPQGGHGNGAAPPGGAGPSPGVSDRTGNGAGDRRGRGRVAGRPGRRTGPEPAALSRMSWPCWRRKAGPPAVRHPHRPAVGCVSVPVKPGLFSVDWPVLGFFQEAGLRLGDNLPSLKKPSGA